MSQICPAHALPAYVHATTLIYTTCQLSSVCRQTFLCVEVSVTSDGRCQGGGLRILSRHLEAQTRAFRDATAKH